MTTIGDIEQWDGFEYICTEVDAKGKTSTWVRRDRA